MTGFQKFIKYAAIAFGIYLSITIVFVLMGIASRFVDNSNESFTEMIEDKEKPKLKDISEEYTDITNIEIDLKHLKMIIKKGEKFKIEGTNIPEKLEIKQNKNQLKISDENMSTNFYTVNNVLTIYIPEEQKLDNIEIEAEDISLDAERLNAINLKLDTYNNDSVINELFVDNLEIHNEYGEIEVKNSEVKTLKLDSESGTEDINIKIAEKAEMDLEYSTTNIVLAGTLENYEIRNKKQFGTIYIDGKEVIDKEENIGKGNSKINIESKYTEMYMDFEEATNEYYL